MKIGYISVRNLERNKKKFTFLEAPYTRRISSRGDRIFSKLLAFPFDYSDIESTTKIFKENNSLILVGEPFFLDDELKERVTRWVEWANNADPSEYDPFAK